MKKFFTCLLATMLIAAPTLFIQAYGQSLAERNYPPINTVSFTKSNLPIVIITTPNQLNRKTRVFGHMVVINNVDENGNPMTNYVDTVAYPNQNIECDNPIALKWRGSSSFGNDGTQTKKPISVKTLKDGATDIDGKKDKVKLLGMGKDNDWVLLAPWQDASYVRDILTMTMARGGSVFAPQMRYCEVIFNGIYYGIYILSERATKGKNRLNLWDYGVAEDADGKEYATDDTTGDFHVEIDRPMNNYTGEVEYYYTSRYHPVWTSGREITDKYIIYQYKDPEEEDFAADKLGESARQAVHTAIDNMETAFYQNAYFDASGNFNNIDATSFMDFEIAQEVSNNIDGYRLSTPMYKYSTTHAQALGDNDKWKMALWDFNIAYGHSFGSYYKPSRAAWRYTANDIMDSQLGSGGTYNDDQLIPFYWRTLMNDDSYVEKLKERYTARRKSSYTDARVQTICDSLRAILNQDAVTRDNQAWNYNFNGWSSEIDDVVSFTKSRLAWMDAYWLVSSTEPEDPEPTTSTIAAPLAVASGYNMDVISEIAGDIPSSSPSSVTGGTYAGIDNSGYVFYTSSVRVSGAMVQDDGLYGGDNAKYYVNVAGLNALVLKDQSGITSGTLELASPIRLEKLYVTGTAADGESTVNVTVNYTDGTSGAATSFYMPDWGSENYSNATAVLTQRNRIKISDGSSSTRNHFSVFELGISTDASKAVKSVTFQKVPQSNSDRCAAIFSLSGVAATTDFTLEGTTLWKDGSWNTLCLPFNVDDLEGTPLEGATVKTLEASAFTGGALSLTFTEGSLDHLVSGHPYIVKWDDTSSNVDDPTFKGVVISGEETPAETEYIDFVGKFSAYTLDADDNTVLYLGANSTLYYPAVDITLKPYRCYFQLQNGLVSHDDTGTAQQIRSLHINFNDEAQGIDELRSDDNTEQFDANTWYTLDGRRLTQRPTQSGIYLHQGRRVMIK